MSVNVCVDRVSDATAADQVSTVSEAVGTSTAAVDADGVVRLPVPFAARVLRDVASALAYPHEQEHAHGDVRKGNVLL